MQAGPEFLLKPTQLFLNPEGDILGMYFTETFWHIKWCWVKKKIWGVPD